MTHDCTATGIHDEENVVGLRTKSALNHRREHREAYLHAEMFHLIILIKEASVKARLICGSLG